MLAQAENRLLDNLIDPSFWGIIRLFALLFQNILDQLLHTKYVLSTEEYYNVLTDGTIFLINQ